MKLEDLTCPECGRTLYYKGTFTLSDKSKIQEYTCPCGFSKDVPIQKKEDKK